MQHKNIIKHENYDAERRGGFYPFNDTEARDKAILNDWKRRINRKDNVYIVGDLSLSLNVKEMADILATLPGRKHIILGNHDRNNYTDLMTYQNAHVVSVDRLKTISDNGVTVVLCHFPILFWEHQHKGSVLLYGHVHDSYEEDLFQMAGTIIQHNRLPEFRAINAGACRNGFGLSTLNELLTHNGLTKTPFPRREHHNTGIEDQIKIVIQPADSY